MATMNLSAGQSSVKWWQSLRFNLIVTMIAISIIPIIVIGVILADQFRAHTIEQVTDQLQSVSTLKSSDINSWLESANSTLNILVETPFTYEPLSEVLTADEVDASRVESLNIALANTVEASHILDGTFVYNLRGQILLSSNPADVGKIVSRQPYFSGSMGEEEYYIQSPFYDITSTELTIIATRHITDEAGEIIGIVAGRLNTQTLSDIMLERSGLGESGETYLVSLENNYFLTPSRFDGYVLNRAYTSYGIEQALQQIEGSGIYDSYREPAVPVIGVYQWIPQLQSAMMVEITEAEALSAFNQALVSTLGVIVLAAVIASLIGVFLSQRISSPITRLSQTAQAIASGDLSRRTSIKGKGEIAVLGRTFNQMTEELSHNIQQLDANIQKTEKANRELAKQTALAREATRLKSEFLATMSHELRTPLNAITGFTGIMLFDADTLDEDNVHMLHRIEANAVRLLTLIDDVLDLSKIEAGRVEIVDEPIQIEALVDQWIAETSILAENKSLPLDFEVTPNFPETIYGDSARLTQIAKNLLSNAIKFTDKGKVSLRVSTKENQWLIEVTDTGIGIPPHAQNYIFDEFRQVDGSSKRVYGGTGLGLAITRNLVLMMNGTIDVTSTLGAGSTFTVRLPIRIGEVAEPVTAS